MAGLQSDIRAAMFLSIRPTQQTRPGGFGKRETSTCGHDLFHYLINSTKALYPVSSLYSEFDPYISVKGRV